MGKQFHSCRKTSWLLCKILFARFLLGKKKNLLSKIAEVIVSDYLGINFTVLPFSKRGGSFFGRCFGLWHCCSLSSCWIHPEAWGRRDRTSGEGNVCFQLQEASSSQGISTGTGNCVGSIRYSVIIQIFFFTALLE